MFKQQNSHKILLFLVLSVIIFTDQSTKIHFQQMFIAKNQQNPLFEIIPNFLDFSYAENTGIAFSIDINGWFFNVLVGMILISLLIAIFFDYWIPFFKEITGKLQKYSLPIVFILGGGFGNLIDRIRLHYVIDFIHFSFWPIFNIADSFVSIGSIILIYLLYKNKELE